MVASLICRWAVILHKAMKSVFAIEFCLAPKLKAKEPESRTFYGISFFVIDGCGSPEFHESKQHLTKRLKTADCCEVCAWTWLEAKQALSKVPMLHYICWSAPYCPGRTDTNHVLTLLWCSVSAACASVTEVLRERCMESVSLLHPPSLHWLLKTV